jgi:hypothetical protein
LQISNSYVCIFLLQFKRVFILQQENEIVFLFFLEKTKKQFERKKEKGKALFLFEKRERMG